MASPTASCDFESSLRTRRAASVESAAQIKPLAMKLRRPAPSGADGFLPEEMANLRIIFSPHFGPHDLDVPPRWQSAR